MQTRPFAGLKLHLHKADPHPPRGLLRKKLNQRARGRKHFKGDSLKQSFYLLTSGSCGMAWTPVASYFILALQSEQLLVNRRSLQALKLIVA